MEEIPTSCSWTSPISLVNFLYIRTIGWAACGGTILEATGGPGTKTQLPIRVYISSGRILYIRPVNARSLGMSWQLMQSRDFVDNYQTEGQGYAWPGLMSSPQRPFQCCQKDRSVALDQEEKQDLGLQITPNPDGIRGWGVCA